jgi:uncharacterized protein
MAFDWNPANCASDIAERGIDFADVVAGFADPARKVVRDARKDYGEARYNMLARGRGPGLSRHLHRARQDHLDHLRAESE